MAIEKVSTTTNRFRFPGILHDNNGQIASLLIEEGRALIDKDGVVRFFAVFNRNGYSGYVLKPHVQSVTNFRVPDAAEHVAEFLAAYGLSRSRGQLVRHVQKRAPGLSAAQTEVIQVAAFFIFREGVDHVMHSFAKRLFTQVRTSWAYHDIMTDAQVYQGKIEYKL